MNSKNNKYEFESHFDYKIKEIETQFSEFHDKILMKELVEFCGIHDVFEYEVSVDMLKEALDLYIQKKENEKFGKDNNVPTKWIPVSERLPEKNVEVLATTEWGAVTIAEMYRANDWFIHEGTTHAKTDEIVAWMPLPEPYKESEV